MVGLARASLVVLVNVGLSQKLLLSVSKRAAVLELTISGNLPVFANLSFVLRAEALCLARLFLNQNRSLFLKLLVALRSFDRRVGEVVVLGHNLINLRLEIKVLITILSRTFLREERIFRFKHLVNTQLRVLSRKQVLRMSCLRFLCLCLLSLLGIEEVSNALFFDLLLD